MKLFISISMGALASVALCQAPAALKASFQKDYEAMSQAFTKRQVAVFDKYLAKGFYLIQPDGKKWTRDKVMSDFKTQMGNMKNPVWRRTITDLKVSGNTAMVTVNGTFNGLFMMRDKKVHTFYLKSVSHDTWQIKPTHQILSSKIESLNPQIDGKAAPRG